MRGRITLLIIATLALFAAAPAEAQIHNCGDLNIIFLNPDLQPGPDGVIRASGSLFAQFQVIGEGADKVEYIGFSFGVDTVEFDESSCNDEGIYYTGQAIQNYRADTNKEDGFFINLQTGLVPDGAYTAAVHAFDADDNELARFWAQAIVENCDQDTAPGVQRCGDDDAQMIRNDFTKPWPIVLPGDGNEGPDDGFTLEFAEELTELKVTLNTVDISEELATWPGRMWDNDLKPGYGPFGLLGDNQLTQECNDTVPEFDQVHKCEPLGVAYEWKGRQLVDDDVLRVEALDLAGNEVTKDIHIGSGVTGGAISDNIPILEWQVDKTAASLASGESALFKYTIRNSGAATGHPFADQEVPEGWTDFEWTPAHVPIESGTTKNQEFSIKPPADAAPGEYDIVTYMRYDQTGTEKVLQQILKITVTGEAIEGEGDEGPADVDGKKGTPAPALPVMVLLAGLAFAARRRI